MTDVEKQPCLVCREPINKGALFCNKCNSHQDWRRHIPLSNNVLSLLVALVSVSAIAVPAIVSAFKSQTSDVRVTMIRSREHETVKNYLPDRKFDFQLYVANVGNRRGAIGRVQMRPKGGGSDSWEDLDFTPHYAKTMNEMIEPGTATFLYYSRASLYSSGAFQDRPLPEEVQLKVEVINSDAGRDYVEINMATGGKQGNQALSDQPNSHGSPAESLATVTPGQVNGIEGYWEQRFYQYGAWHIAGVSLIARDDNGQLTMTLVDTTEGIQGSKSKSRVFDIILEGNRLSFKSDWGGYGIGTFRLEREGADKFVGASYEEDGSEFAKNEFRRVEYIPK